MSLQLLLASGLQGQPPAGPERAHAQQAMAHHVLSPSAVSKIAAYVERFRSNKGAVMLCKKGIFDVLKDEGACYQRQLTPMQVAVHPKNRDGQMITASGVYDRAVRLMGVGFDLKIFEEEAFCVEDHPLSKEIAKGAKKHFQTDNRFAVYSDTEIVAGSVGASHTNHLLAATIQGRPCDNESISIDGKLDVAAWSKHTDFQKACSSGCLWWCIKWQVEETWPDIPEIFQSALNAKQHVGSGYRP